MTAHTMRHTEGQRIYHNSVLALRFQWPGCAWYFWSGWDWYNFLPRVSRSRSLGGEHTHRIYIPHSICDCRNRWLWKRSIESGIDMHIWFSRDRAEPSCFFAVLFFLFLWDFLAGMSKSTKVSVFEIRGEIHYTENESDSSLKPIKYFCVSFCNGVPPDLLIYFSPDCTRLLVFFTTFVLGVWSQVLKENTLYFFTKPRVRHHAYIVGAFTFYFVSPSWLCFWNLNPQANKQIQTRNSQNMNSKWI